MQALQKIVGGDQARAQSLATRTEENIYENTVTRAQWGHHMSSKINSILAKNNQVRGWCTGERHWRAATVQGQ